MPSEQPAAIKLSSGLQRTEYISESVAGELKDGGGFCLAGGLLGSIRLLGFRSGAGKLRSFEDVDWL